MIAFVFVSIVFANSYGQTTVTLTPSVKDVWAEQLNPNTNYGSSNNLFIGRDPGGEYNHSFIYWDISSLPSCIDITNAEIRVDQKSTYPDIVCVHIRRVTSPWNENSVTYNNQPSSSGSYGTYCGFNSTSGYKFIPVTSLVQDLLIYGNDGVMLYTPSTVTPGKLQWFSSREDGTANSRPRLIITYTTQTPPTANPISTSTTCGNCNGSVSANASGGTTPYNYLWSNGCTSASCSSLCAGTYSVTVTDANGCTVSGSTSVGGSTFTVNLSTINVTSSSGNTSFSINTSDSWTVSESCSWLSVSSTSGLGNSTITVNYNANTSGVRTCTITVTCGSSTETVTVTQDGQTPSLTVSTNSVTICENSGCNGSFNITSNVSWTVTDNQTWLSVNPTSGSGNGGVTVTATTANPSTSIRTATVTVSGTGVSDKTVIVTQNGTPSGIEEIGFISKLTIHPNPNSGEFTLEMELTKPEDFEIKVINITGQIIYKEKLQGISGKYQKTIDISNFANGIYTVQLITDKGTVNKQITVH